MRSCFKPVVLAIGLAFGVIGTLSSSGAFAADPVEEVFSLVSKGQYRQALTNVDRVLENNPKDLNARFMRGVILSELNRPDEAIEVFKKLNEEQPELPEPYNNLAALYAQQRRYLDARDALEKAIRINPAYTTALENLGDLYLRLAGDIYAKARNLEDASPETTRKLASVKSLIGGSRDIQMAATEAKKPAAASGATSATAPLAENTPPKDKAAAKAEAAAAKAEAAKQAELAKAEAKAEAARLAEQAKAEAKAEAARKAEAKKAEKAEQLAAQGATGTPAAAFDEAAVEQAVRAWAEAWASKNLEGYFAAYAADFRPATPGGRAKWENQRRERIEKPESISVQIEGLAIKKNKDKAVATFTQLYRSPIHKSDDSKTLVLAQRDGAWRIVEERVAK